MDTNQQFRDQDLWRIAKKRAGFKWSLLCYIIVNALMVGVWFMGDQDHFWPAWCMFGWGIGIAFQYMKAYHGKGTFSAEKEYEKLKEQQR